MGKGTCSYDGCVKPARCRSWCTTHYARWRKHGDPSVVLPPVAPPRSPRTQGEHCSVEGCAAAPWARNLCSKHYIRWRKYGDPLEVRRRRPSECRIDGCDRTARGHGLCSRHYRLWREHGDPLWSPDAYTVCSIDSCDRPPRNAANPLCEAHYCRLWRNGSLDPGACSVCGETLPRSSPSSRRFCAPCSLERRRSRSRDAEHRRRSLKVGGGSERFDDRATFERDRWRCGICRKRVDERLRWPHPLSASVDHMVPISEGGLHTRANVRLAHLTCNTSRGNRGGNEQLALVG